jgi:hypothetical protein
VTALTDDELIEELRSTLHRRANDVRDVRDALDHFDPTQPGADISVVTPPVPRRHGSPWLKAAVILVLIGAVAALVVVRSSHHSRVDVTSTPGDPLPPDTSNVPGGLAPRSAPAGTQLWSIDWNQEASDPVSTRTELFGQADGQGGEVLVQVTDANPGSTGCCTPVLVRGQQGQVGPAKEFPETTSNLSWQEDATISASFKGMSQADAISFIDSLQWRGPDHRGGFDVPAGAAMTLLGEVAGDPPTSLATTLELTYRDTPASVDIGTGVQREVRATVGPGRETSRYLKTWFDGSKDSDGIARSYETAFGTYSEAAPDGRYVWVDANKTPSTEAELRAISDSLVPQTGAELLALRAQAEGAAAALPSVASIPLPSGVVDVRGDAEARTVCLRVDAVTRCSVPTPDLDGGAVNNVGSFLVGGEWYVVYASTNDPQVTSGHSPPPYNSTNPDVLTPVPSERSADGAWHAVLSRPTNLQRVQIADGDQLSGDVLRPAF